MMNVREDGILFMLVDADGNPVDRGDDLTDFRGNPSVLDSAECPRHSGSTGRVNNYYPSVYNLKWKEM